MSSFCSLRDSTTPGKTPLTVEVQLKKGSTHVAAAVAEATRKYFEALVCVPYVDGPLADFSGHPLAQHIAAIALTDCDTAKQRLSSMAMFWNWELEVFVFELSEEEPEDDDCDDGGEGNDEPTSMFREWPLPSASLHGLWDSLHFDDDDAAGGGSERQGQAAASGRGGEGGEQQQRQRRSGGAAGSGAGAVKRRLLKYAGSALLFSERGVNSSLVAWNRVILLHGPPGTGKTSLCKALAHKLAIRFGNRYPAGCSLVEVNAHSLFSKYFSESGKLVGRLFARINELIEEGDALVFVLIDEVESLTAARKAGGSEPTDAIRAVNALLTQLDQLRHHPNVMVLTTSNITGAIDAAFVDRADIKAYIGPPSLHARYKILRSAVLELARAGICSLGQETAASASAPSDAGSLLLPFTEIPEMDEQPAVIGCNTAEAAAAAASASTVTANGGGGDTAMADCNGHGGSSGQSAAVALSRALAQAAATCEGLSGRSLRKLPFLAHAGADWMPVPCPAATFIEALRRAAEAEKRDRQDMGAQQA